MYSAIYFVSKTVCIKYYTLGIKGLKWSDMKIQICDTHFIHEHLSCFLLLLLQIPLLHKSWSLFENRVAKKLDLFSWLKECGTASANCCWILFSSGFSFLVDMWTSSLGDSTMLVVMAYLEVQPLVTMRLMSKTKPPLKMVVFKTFVHLVCFFPSFKANNQKY